MFEIHVTLCNWSTFHSADLIVVCCGSTVSRTFIIRVKLTHSLIYYTTSCKHSLMLLKMDEIVAPKHVELIGIINKQLLLHLFGCLYYF